VVPTGTSLLAAALLVNGIATYAFFGLIRRHLGADEYSAIAVLWGLMLILGPGLFQPLEQEVARNTTARVHQGVGSAPVLRAAARIGLFEVAVLSILLVALWPIGLGSLLRDQPLLLVALITGMLAIAASHLARGLVAGRRRFGRYASYFIGDGIARLVALGILIALGVSTAGWFGLAIGSGFLAGFLVLIVGRQPFALAGPPATTAQLRPALGLLLFASLAEAIILNAGPVLVELLGDEPDEAGRFLNGLIISRVPLFLFQAVKASLLPSLTELDSMGDFRHFLHTLRRIAGAVMAFVAVGSIGAALIGPLAVEMLFRDELTSFQMALMAFGSGVMMLVQTLSAALVAMQRAKRAVVGWAAGVLAVLSAFVLPGSAITRVAGSLAIGAAVCAGVLASLVIAGVRRSETARSETARSETARSETARSEITRTAEQS
jgi:O-antigen/teichoic acid export membrane protein